MPYLKRALAGILRQRHVADVRVMVWSNAAGRETVDYLKTQPVRLYDCPDNAGQHIAMNEMLDAASRMNATYFVRVDEDCVFQTTDWLHRLLVAHESLWNAKVASVLSPVVNGLKHPPPTRAKVIIARRRYELVDILGGICRLHPMDLLRHFRFEERLPMGGGEASQLSNLCRSLGVQLLRYPKVQVSHGGSTQTQEAENPVWAYEHDMAQFIPCGL